MLIRLVLCDVLGSVFYRMSATSSVIQPDELLNHVTLGLNFSLQRIDNTVPLPL